LYLGSFWPNFIFSFFVKKVAPNTFKGKLLKKIIKDINLKKKIKRILLRKN